jgi:8-oxo-dGTP pyrophosphatase MutT (NUDIX family)
MAYNLSMSNAERWPVVSEEVLGTYSIFKLICRVHRAPASRTEHPFMLLEVPDWINVIPVTPDGELILVEQYRHGTDQVTIEIPGGTVDPGEKPMDTAARELEEETGYLAETIVQIGSVEPNPAFLTNTCWTFLALGCTPDGTADPDPTEEIWVQRIALHEFADLIDNGTITHSLTVAAHDHLQRGLRRGEAWAKSLL